MKEIPSWNGGAHSTRSESPEPLLTLASPTRYEEAPLPDEFDVPTVFQDMSADILLQSSDHVLFRVHKIILTLGSSHFKDVFLLDEFASRVDSEATPIQLDEPATIVAALLYRLYPIVKPDITDVDEMLLVAVAAHKYRMEGVLAQVQAQLLSPAMLDARPLAIYNAACRLQLGETKRCAARRLVELYDPLDKAIRADTEGLSAPDFIVLCDLRRDRISHCIKLMDDHFPAVCPHGWQFEYGPWYQALRAKLSQKPSASVLASIPDLADAFAMEPSRCGYPECTTSGLLLQDLKEALADTDRFIGEEDYL
ncbi:hypothetical protein CALCODRAFT_485459 [Calocera cornea HHB12733]|uniref:BTB domain-containing protein n=1 Tax=Calocera cornea HHB12733 TaxID=1353952 RepID=A0A165EDA8_9BASI|nr:hypothetical protein CALCODRAFT_485459 [Calocera cornea HHB12733]